MNEQLKPYKTVEQIAKKHRLDVSFIQKQLDMGAPIEHEHTNNQKLAVEIALQHLDEIPDYYTRLKKMEASAKKEHRRKFKDVTEARKMKGKNPCWKRYEMIGKKNKGGKEVPNCVPVKEETGMVRYCPKCKKDETQSECKYGPKFWALYSTPSMLTTNQMKFDIAQVHPANEEKDHEYSMARSEISTIISAAKRLKKKMNKGEGNIEAWVQSKITKAADYIDTAADYIDSGEMKKESVSIEDANGNHYAEFIDIIKPQPLKASKGIGSQLVGEGALPSTIDPSSHRQAQKTQKLYNKGIGTDNSNEKEIFLKRTGPQLPLAKKEDKKEVQVAHYNMKTFGKFMSEAKKSEMKCNSPKSEPVGDSLTGKSHVVKACENGKEKLIRFGQRGVKGSPKKKGESKEYASRRHRFQTRHAKNIAKGKMSAAYWANKVKW
jgi:hypothetical protein